MSMTNPLCATGIVPFSERTNVFCTELSVIAVKKLYSTLCAFLSQNATLLQKMLQFFLEKGRFPIDSLVIIGV